MDINRATIVGNLTRDPEVRTTPTGLNVTSFGVATNFIWKDANGEKKQSAEFHNVVAWRRLGEIAAQYLRKGRRVLVEGRLQTRTWEGQDGSKRNRTEIIAENLIMLDGRPAQGGPAVSQSEEVPAAGEPAPNVQEESRPPTSAGRDPDEISVEDIPF